MCAGPRLVHLAAEINAHIVLVTDQW